MLAITPQSVLEQANTLILQSILDAKKARLLEIALRSEAMQLYESGSADDALKLQLVADDLASRFQTPVKIKLSAMSPL